ncbi:dihydrodipicolinate reductase [Roseicyclus sediminis]|jgi:hypothetical protein|uniref:dihydrodipicolinate reductase n=1 Tax=Roseicyclus sediminis TaxID=2980997 RepID=UPI0021CF2875|nr:dihydrodipicolinate reductase [Roseibacterium sp. SDUM158016]
MFFHALKAPALAAGFVTAMTTAEPARSEAFSVVSSRDTFVSLVQGRELRRFGIRLTVTPDGEIVGRAFGTPVTGQWDWDGGYFCRDLFFGQEDLGFNCQLVQVNGETLRFTTDQGQGIYADLTLR